MKGEKVKESKENISDDEIQSDYGMIAAEANQSSTELSQTIDSNNLDANDSVDHSGFSHKPETENNDFTYDKYQERDEEGTDEDEEDTGATSIQVPHSHSDSSLTHKVSKPENLEEDDSQRNSKILEEHEETKQTSTDFVEEEDYEENTDAIEEDRKYQMDQPLEDKEAEEEQSEDEDEEEEIVEQKQPLPKYKNPLMNKLEDMINDRESSTKSKSLKEGDSEPSEAFIEPRKGRQSTRIQSDADKHSKIEQSLPSAAPIKKELSYANKAPSLGIEDEDATLVIKEQYSAKKDSSKNSSIKEEESSARKSTKPPVPKQPKVKKRKPKPVKIDENDQDVIDYSHLYSNFYEIFNSFVLNPKFFDPSVALRETRNLYSTYISLMDSNILFAAPQFKFEAAPLEK